MSSLDSRGRFPQDIVAIFHASFHPTQGNVIDWSMKASEDLNLDHLEFSALPSGLHLVEQDVVYFTKDAHRGICVFRRRATTERGHRGFRLSSLGILLAKSVRPRPWRHAASLKELVTIIYTRLENNGVLEPTESDWEPARAFFNDRKVRRADLSGAGDWNGWNDELDIRPEVDSEDSNPTIHLPHLLRILGPSSITLYKYVLGRQRILLYTQPPVEAACILCQVAADMCYWYQLDADVAFGAAESSQAGERLGKLKGKCKEGINVLGVVTLCDVDRMHEEGKTGRGWIACTTDAIFLEKPSCYDLVIDLTTVNPNKATRPTLLVCRPLPQPVQGRGPTHQLSATRFAWSDLKLWNELDRVLQLDTASHAHTCCGSLYENDNKSKLITTWTDVWRVYEDVCIICAGLWMGSWRGNAATSYSVTSMANWGSVKLDGDDDLTLGGSYVRNLGMGIEGRPSVSTTATGGIGSSVPSTTSKAMKRSSGMSWSSKTTAAGSVRQVSTSSTFSPSTVPSDGPPKEDVDASRNRQVLMTLTLLQTFHTHTCFQISKLKAFLSTPSEPRIRSMRGFTVYLTPRDMTSFELGPLSSIDARYLEWLAAEYGDGTRVVVRKGWRDLLGLVFGYG